MALWRFFILSIRSGYDTVWVMFEKLKDKALRAALPLLAGSAVGRMVIDKGLAIVGKRLVCPLRGITVRRQRLGLSAWGSLLPPCRRW